MAHRHVRSPGAPVRRHRDAEPLPPEIANRVLAQLPAFLLARLKPLLAPVHLEHKEVLFRAHERQRVVYFPASAVVSFVSRLASGDTLEVGLIGRDGFAGTAIFPGITSMSCDGIVQVPGVAYRMSADALRRLVEQEEALSSALGRFAQVLLVRSMQMSVCNMFHSVEQRCIRWLLTVHDLTGDADIPLTHELLATTLGVHRPTVTLVIQALHRAGLIDEARGRIRIRDRRGLEGAACECYQLMRAEQGRLMDAGAST